ncbi:putative disease resistance protein At3g14460 [Salvia hispanica]|uniref:putative disease resistance protein At3g14460 n=1 Tax=Salvia hispanica TaxID=49212 RepID=UPI0020094BF1|nr:putative disease resistance protein At3g14460 [Salvia hispanica]
MLWGRRYLVVLDDMWSIEAWEEIQTFLPDNGDGSCVIVTTRLFNLATSLSCSPFKMRFLGNDKSWELFCGKVFGDEYCPIELEEIGKKIVERCGGLPLSIVVIGGHLKKSSREIEYWEKVASFINPISSIGADADDQCLKIISLSYEHLPAWEMPQLRHLEFKRFYLPDPIPNDQEEECIVLRNLHILKGVENLRLTHEVCNRMPNVKVLSLLYDDDHFSCCEASSYYCSQNLGCFNILESLECKFGNGVVLSFTCPTSLTELWLQDCHLQWEGLSMTIASLPHLRSLRLGKLEGSEWNLVDEEFSSLEFLEISRCEDLIYWNANSSHFPILKFLDILELPKLGEIPFDIGEVPTLEAIRLEGCSMRLAMSA